MGRSKRQKNEYSTESESSPEAEERRRKMAGNGNNAGAEGITLDVMRELLPNQSKQLSEIKEEIKENGDRIMDCVTARIKELEVKIEAVEETNAQLVEKNRALEARLIQVERDARRNNIIVTGLDSDSATDSIKELQSVIHGATEGKIMLQNCRPLHTRTGLKIIATCKNAEEKRAIMTVRRGLVRRKDGKDTPIYIDNDMPQEDRSVQAKIRAIAKELRAKGNEVMEVPGKLRVNGTWMQYDASTNEVIPANNFRWNKK